MTTTRRVQDLPEYVFLLFAAAKEATFLLSDMRVGDARRLLYEHNNFDNVANRLRHAIDSAEKSSSPECGASRDRGAIDPDILAACKSVFLTQRPSQTMGFRLVPTYALQEIEDALNAAEHRRVTGATS